MTINDEKFKEGRREYAKKYREENPEKVKQYSRKFYNKYKEAGIFKCNSCKTSFGSNAHLLIHKKSKKHNIIKLLNDTQVRATIERDLIAKTLETILNQ